jgi:hypothetical protein
MDGHCHSSKNSPFLLKAVMVILPHLLALPVKYILVSLFTMQKWNDKWAWKDPKPIKLFQKHLAPYP